MHGGGTAGVLSAKMIHGGRRALVVAGKAPAGKTVVVALLRGGKVVSTKRVRSSKGGSFRIVFKLKSRGAYSARATVRSGGKTLTKTTKAKRI